MDNNIKVEIENLDKEIEAQTKELSEIKSFLSEPKFSKEKQAAAKYLDNDEHYKQLIVLYDNIQSKLESLKRQYQHEEGRRITIQTGKDYFDDDWVYDTVVSDPAKKAELAPQVKKLQEERDEVWKELSKMKEDAYNKYIEDTKEETENKQQRKQQLVNSIKALKDQRKAKMLEYAKQSEFSNIIEAFTDSMESNYELDSSSIEIKEDQNSLYGRFSVFKTVEADSEDFDWDKEDFPYRREDDDMEDAEIECEDTINAVLDGMDSEWIVDFVEAEAGSELPQITNYSYDKGGYWDPPSEDYDIDPDSYKVVCTIGLKKDKAVD